MHEKVQSSISISSDYEDECENEGDEEEEDEEEEAGTSLTAITSFSSSSSSKSRTIEFSSYQHQQFQQEQKKLKSNNQKALLDSDKGNIFNIDCIQTNSLKSLGRLRNQQYSLKNQNEPPRPKSQILHSDNDLNCESISSLKKHNRINENKTKRIKNEQRFQTKNRRHITDTGI